MACPCEHVGCGKSFAFKSGLTIHARVHSGERPFRCDASGCNDAFSKLSNLVIHARIHSGKKPFVCSVNACGMAFAQSGSLKKHSRVHTGSKPFVCDVAGCDAAFSDPSNLVIHGRTHNGVKPFVCNVTGCELAFVSSNDLKRHFRVHTGSKPFVCDVARCDAAFSDPSNLSAHKRAHHTPEGQAVRKRDEMKVVRAFEKAGIDFKREHHVSFKCLGRTFARMDFTVQDNGCVVFVETDEYQHDSYGVCCDIARMADIMAALALDGNTLPVAFVRYNPHAFTLDGVHQKVPTTTRLERLIATVRSLVALGPKLPPFSVTYMFYDGESSTGHAKRRLCIWSSPDYDAAVSETCLEPVFG